ncbi:unnamed protein product [Rotaria magnacalcarata]
MLAQRKLDQQVVCSPSDANVELSGTLAICCAAFVLFAIAATVVLSLIPLYVPPKIAERNSCINKADVLLEVALPSRVKPDSIILNNVTMVDDDEKEFGIISSIPIIDLAYLSFIGTKKSKKVQTMQRTTAAVIAKKITTRTTTTTTVLTIAPTSTTTTTTTGT